MTRRAPSVTAPSILPNLQGDDDLVDVEIIVAAAARMKDRHAAGRLNARPGPVQVAKLVAALDDDERRIVVAMLAPDAPDHHVVALKEAAHFFGKSEKQCIRRANELAKAKHPFGWKLGNIWNFDLFHPPPGWRPALG